MTDTVASPQPTAEQVKAFLAKRDLTVDLVRIVCVMLVVVIHSLLVGVGTTHGITITRPAQQHEWFRYATWFLQIMPLFFIVGGFASWQGWQSVVRKQLPWQEFFRARVLRLVYPALIWFTVILAVISIAMLVGVPGAMLEQIVGGLGMPLWFLAAYLITQFCVPLMARLHTTHRYATLAVLFGAAVLIDLLRYSSGITEIGLINMLFIWVLVQQFGFFYADGSLQRIPRKVLPLIALACFGVVALLGSARELLGTVNAYSPDMLDNLNPPTVPLIFIGLAHLALLLLLKPALDRLMQRRAAQGIVLFLGARAMTIYLWHLLFVILIAALVLVAPLPQPDTAGWWLLRIPAILLAYGFIFLVSLGVARFERGPRASWVGRTPGTLVISLVAILAIIPPFYAMEFTLNIAALVWGTLLLALAVGLSLGRRDLKAEPGPELTLTPSSHRKRVLSGRVVRNSQTGR
jgi:surface polysaccharide O-acyltransferase-like enzyme